MEFVQQFLDVYYGGVYSEEFEAFSDGGPKCAASMTIEFRVTIAAISVAYNLVILYYSWNCIKKSKELDLSLVKNLKPCIWEKLIGYCCIATYLVMAWFKFYTRRGIFMNNPCHFVLLFSGILLITEKTKAKAVMFISYLRWLFGPYSALALPVTVGMDLPYEVNFFWIEHYLAAFVGPLALMLFGRYGFFKQSFKTLIVQQYFGFGIHILYQRLYMMPQSVVTWSNLNFTLCHPESDPTYPIWGNYYYILADIYLNLASFLTVLVHLVIFWVINTPIQFVRSLMVKEKSD